MFVFKRLAEFDFVCERINQVLNTVCPELRISYEIEDCVRIRLHDLNTKKIIEGFKFSNPENTEKCEELAVLAVLKMFFYFLSNSMRVKSRKTVQEMFRSVNHSLNYRWK